MCSHITKAFSHCHSGEEKLRSSKTVVYLLIWQVALLETMTDALSAAGTIVAVIGACSKICQYTVNIIQTLRNAPLEFIQLSNELNDLNAILNELYIASLADTGRRNSQSTAQKGDVAENVVFAT